MTYNDRLKAQRQQRAKENTLAYKITAGITLAVMVVSGSVTLYFFTVVVTAFYGN